VIARDVVDADLFSALSLSTIIIIIIIITKPGDPLLLPSLRNEYSIGLSISFGLAAGV
jgi:hypothetical protein